MKGDVLPCLPVIRILREEPLKPMRLLILALCLQKLLCSLISGAVSQGMYACSHSDERRDKLSLRACSSWNNWRLRLLQIMYRLLLHFRRMSNRSRWETVWHVLLPGTWWEGLWIFQIQIDFGISLKNAGNNFDPAVLKKRRIMRKTWGSC